MIPAPNFDRVVTAYHIDSCDDTTPQTRYMSMSEFHEYVCRGAPDVRAGGPTTDGVIRRCYNDISFFTIATATAYLEARDCARAEVRARLARVELLSRATQSRAPAIRSSITPFMHDRRGGADDSRDEMD